MALPYVQYDFQLVPAVPWAEILLAELEDSPFESFEFYEGGIRAYVPEPLWHEHLLDEITLFKNDEVQIQYAYKTIAPENWNVKWEQNFPPIQVGNECFIRADFHPPSQCTFDLVINPKMSFGTGHHQTTHMMLEFILEEDLTDKKVLDMGCGTGVLAILAAKKGATEILGIDSDPWCITNSNENAAMNACDFIRFEQAEILAHQPNKFDCIFANINKNILLFQIESYALALQPEGKLWISGFYQSDLEDLRTCCSNHGLYFMEQKENEHWTAAKFCK